MAIYATVFTSSGATVAKVQEGKTEYFTGYDFMGSANWTADINKAVLMSTEEADQIADDLTAGE